MESGKTMAIAVVALIIGAAAGIGIGYVMFDGDSESSVTTYSFYLYFGEDDERTGWYSAEGSDASVAFDKAMEDAGLSYEISSIGYVFAIDDVDGNGAGWYIATYLYSETTSAAAEGSIVADVMTSWGTLDYSNGWKSFAGYDGTGLKLSQSNSTIFFLSPYNVDWSAESPVSVTDWMTSGPFA